MSWTHGINAVEQAIQNSPKQIEKLWLVKSKNPGPARRRIHDLAKKKRVRFTFVTPEQLKRELGDVVHQGVAAQLEAFKYADQNDLLNTKENACIIVLDQIQDPHNLGAVLRSAWGFGATGVVITKHRAASVTPVVRKVAAGAAAKVPIARVTNIVSFLKDAKKENFWVWGADTKNTKPIHEIPLTGKIILILGGEGKGLRRLTREHCDGGINIPTQGVESLNVSVAAGILLYEVQRQSLHKS